VESQIPQDLRENLVRDFNEREITAIMATCNRSSAPSVSQPAVLFILGPSAVGKSFITDATAAQLFGSSHAAVILDGELFREKHAGWCDVLMHGMRSSVLHSDAWTLFKEVKTDVVDEQSGKTTQQGISTALKKRILLGAIRDRQNLIIPSCANQPDKLEKDMKLLRDSGYIMHAVCIWAPLSETRARGEPRSVREGKRWDGNIYGISTATVLSVARSWALRMEAEGDTAGSLALWDNTIFPAREVDLGESAARRPQRFAPPPHKLGACLPCRRLLAVSAPACRFELCPLVTGRVLTLPSLPSVCCAEEFATLTALSDAEADEHAWRLKRPRGKQAWSQIKSAIALKGALAGGSAGLAGRFDSVATQTMERGMPMRGGGGGSRLAQRTQGRREGALVSGLLSSLIWGAVLLAVLLTNTNSTLCASAH
jgi:hypothetical protein